MSKTRAVDTTELHRTQPNTTGRQKGATRRVAQANMDHSAHTASGLPNRPQQLGLNLPDRIGKRSRGQEPDRGHRPIRPTITLHCSSWPPKPTDWRA
jgi:hypothetical protein